MYYISNQPPVPVDNKVVRWKDNKQLYFKLYHTQDHLCECGKTIKVSSKYHHMNSLKHKYYLLEKQFNESQCTLSNNKMDIIEYKG